MKTSNWLFSILAGALLSACQSAPEATWVSTTFDQRWVEENNVAAASGNQADAVIDTSRVAQVIDGFGTCFNELGWTSLSKLDEATREAILREMFSPGVGANFTICRMPVAANDFALDWYSYNENEGDFAMEKFSIAHDEQTLIPFIQAAQAYNPDLKIWASPWCPPSWMKYSKHYASRSTMKMARELKESLKEGESTYMSKVVDNGLPEDQEYHEGRDAFIQEEPYFKAYELYFSKFIDAYKAKGIDIFMVMPQNEFNSAQIFPSCCWTAKGLSRFIGQYLGPTMREKGVKLYFGTMERANTALVDTILNDAASGQYVEGVGFQWAGKDALPGIHQNYPQLKFYQTEQECGDGKNDWAGASHSWDLMKHYLKNGVNVYEYWNTSLDEGGVSRWGWSQNSLVVVAPDGKSFTYTPEYFIMKHVSHYVMPGARRIETEGSYEDLLAFINPDRSVVVIAGNNADEARTVTFRINGATYSPTLKAHSVNTFQIK